MYDKILIPLDGSAAAEIVLPYVEEIAARSGAEIHLVSVLAEMDSSTDAALREYLDGLSARLEAEIDSFDPKEETSLRQTVLVGKPATEIIQYADSNEISLIAITASGKSGDGPWLLGNISSKILRGITRPVLLVRAPAAEEPIAKRSLIKKVLVPLDGSELGESAIPQVEACAAARHGISDNSSYARPGIGHHPLGQGRGQAGNRIPGVSRRNGKQTAFQRVEHLQ